MPQPLSHLIVHSVFSTKDRRRFLPAEQIRIETYAYRAGILKNLQCHPIKIGGAHDSSALRELLKRHRVAFDERFLWE